LDWKSGLDRKANSFVETVIVDDTADDGKLAINFDNNVSRLLVQSLKSIDAVLENNARVVLHCDALHSPRARYERPRHDQHAR